MKRWSQEEPPKTQSNSHSCSIRYRPVILGGITNHMQALNLISLLFMVIYHIHPIIYSINSNYTRRHEHEKYCGPASSTSSSATGPTPLERGQLIWKIQIERLTINIVGWHFSQLVWNRPSSSTCGKAPAHPEKSKRQD